MRKVVIFYPHIGEYGGIERNIIALAIEVLQKGFTPVVVCYYDHIDMTQYVPGMEVVVLGDHWNPFAKGKLLSDWLKKYKHEIHGMPLFFGGKAGFYATLSKINVYALHYTDPPSLLTEAKPGGLKQLLMIPRKKISDWILEQGVVCASICITMTHWNAVELEELYGKKFEVVHQGGVPPQNQVNISPRCLSSTLTLFSICRLAGSKKIDWILKAADHLRTTDLYKQHFTDIRIVLAGKGPVLDELKKLSADLNLSAYVSFPGFLTPEELEEAYSNADLFLVPGRQGYGLPVLEALYRHVPVVLNRESRISEILGENKWVAISENTSTSFSQAVEQHINQLRKEQPAAELLSELPTESVWADKLGRTCNWWD